METVPKQDNPGVPQTIRDMGAEEVRSLLEEVRSPAQLRALQDASAAVGARNKDRRQG